MSLFSQEESFKRQKMTIFFSIFIFFSCPPFIQKSEHQHCKLITLASAAAAVVVFKDTLSDLLLIIITRRLYSYPFARRFIAHKKE